MLKISRPLKSITTVIHAWSSVCSQKSFFGMTIDQYKLRMQACHDVRVEIAEARKRLKSLIAKRKDVDTAAFQLTKNVVYAVRADPTEGENSPFYAAMGYVRPGERRRGYRRASVPATAVAAPDDRLNKVVVEG